MRQFAESECNLVNMVVWCNILCGPTAVGCLEDEKRWKSWNSFDISGWILNSKDLNRNKCVEPQRWLKLKELKVFLPTVTCFSFLKIND